MVLRPRYLAVVFGLLFFVPLVSSFSAGYAEEMQASEPVVVYQFSGQITGVTTLAVQDLLITAENLDAQLVLIELSTTGGELGAVRQIMQLFATASIPVLVHVPLAAQAVSGGTYLLMAAHIASMGSAARIGSCQPLAGIFPVTDLGYLDSLVTLMTAFTHLHERNETTGTKFILENLNLGAMEAQNLGSIELIANTIPELLSTLEAYTLVQRELQPNDFTYRLIPTNELGNYTYTQIIQDFNGVAGATQFYYQPNFSLTILAFLAHPTISFILLQIGIWGFIFALNAPGHAGEVISLVCIILALVGLGIIGISIAGLVLMVLGLVLLVIEAKADIAFAGFVGLIGIACFVLGGIFFLPPTQWLIPSYVMWIFQGGSAAVALIFSSLFGYAVIKAAEARRLTSDFDPKKMPGTKGIAETNLDPEGRVRALGETWMAETEKGVIKAGESIEIVRLEGIRLIVKKSQAPDEFIEQGS